MRSHSQSRSKQARRFLSGRLQVEALEVRLPPGDVAFGGMLALSVLGPGFSPLAISFLASENSDAQPSPAVLKSARADSAIVPAAFASIVTLGSTDVSPNGGGEAQAQLGTNVSRAETAAAAAPGTLTIDPFEFVPSSLARTRRTSGGTLVSVRQGASGSVGATHAPAGVHESGATLAYASKGQSGEGSGGVHSIPADPVNGQSPPAGPHFDNVRANSRVICPDGHGVIQSETAVAVSGNAVVVGYNDFRAFYCPGGTYQVEGWAYSLDGGQTFTDGGHLPGGTSLRGDPWLATGPDGTIYMASLWNGTAGVAVLRGTVTDTGINWSNPWVLTGGSFDKESLSVDPNSGTIYLTYTRLGSGIYLLRSTDGGVSFSGPTPIGTVSTAQGSVSAVGPNGELYVAYANGFPTTTGIGFARSFDGGDTFQVSGQIQRVQAFNIAGTDRAPFFPHIAVDTTGGKNDGNIYVSWQSAHVSGKGDALLTRSTDAGDTWSDPLIINDEGGVGIQWYPTISVDANGNLNAFFNDRRENPGTSITNLYFAQSVDGGQSFNPNIKVTDVPSTWRTFSDGTPAWGDYINSTVDGADALVAWADGRDGDPDAYFARVPGITK